MIFDSNIVCITICITLAIVAFVFFCKMRAWKKQVLVKDKQLVLNTQELTKQIVGIQHELTDQKENYEQVIKGKNLDIEKLSNSLTETKEYYNCTVERLEKKNEELENKIENEIDSIVDERTKEIESQTQSAVENVVKELDESVGNKIKEIVANHTLHFQCACSKNPADKIPCYIDFTKQNEFQCKKCGAKYRVEISAYPILLSRDIDESVLAEEIQKQIDNKFGNND